MPGAARQPAGPALDATLLSDDRVIEGGSWGFTGAFVGLCAQDSAESGIQADFDDFSYRAVGAPARASSVVVAAAAAST